MNYRSIADMNDAILQNLGRLPRRIDLVVGASRSGLLAANLLGLALNVPITDVEGLLAGRVLAGEPPRRTAAPSPAADAERTIVVIDDGADGGEAMRAAKERFAAGHVPGRIVTCAVFGATSDVPDVDVVLEAVPQPCLFQWTVFHHALLERCCVDIDGVLCCDPTAEENDDGAAYRGFLERATPMMVPTRPIGWLVTSRLEKYRPQTEAWLRAAGIAYRELVMLDLPSAEERRRANAHGGFKAKVYEDLDAVLFIESEHAQAEKIAELSGKPVLCLETNHLVEPAPSPLSSRRALGALPRRIRLAKTLPADRNSLKLAVRSMLGEAHWARLKAVAGLARPSRR